jgi:Ca-activated chloride channel homolog
MNPFASVGFVWPHLLWLLLVPAAAAVAELTRRVRGAATAHPKIVRAEAAPGRLTLLSGHAGPTAPVPRVRWRLWLGLALSVFALARPQWGEVEEQVFDQAREILIAVDLSRSMLAPDVPPSRLERAKLLITSLLERLEGERVGLVVFAGTAFLQSPLSSDYEILREFLPALNPDFLPEGGTNYSALLQTALDAFGKTDGADRFLIILSDGESTVEDWQKLVTPLRERSVKVLGLGIGTPEGAMLPDGQGGFVKDERGAVVLSRLHPATLEDLAQRTNGVYRDASSWVDLAELLRATVEAGRQGEFTEVSRLRRVERFQWPLAAALLVLLWSFWREFPVHPRPRTLALTPTAAPVPNPTVRSGVAGWALLLLTIVLAPKASAAANAGNPYAGPLSQVVGRIAVQSEVSAKDLAEMADATLTYGQRMTGSGQSPEPGAIQDALEAVRLGERLDPRAADWQRLREALEALQPPEPPESEQDQQDQPDQQSDDQKSGQSKPDPSRPQDQQRSEQDESSSPPPSESDPSSGQDGNEESPQEPATPRDSEDDSAFGDMNEPPPDPSESETNNADTQTVGGQSDRRPTADDNPALTVPLQKLEQLKQQDSPAKLFQLMQDPNARPPVKGRDW